MNYPQMFAGLAIVFFGLLVIIYDYPQILFLENLPEQEFLNLEETTKEKYSRLKLEIFIGLGLVTFGAILITLGFLERQIFPWFKK